MNGQRDMEHWDDAPSFLSSDTVTANLALTEDRQRTMTQARLCEISALADEAVSLADTWTENGMCLSEILSAVAAAYPSLCPAEKKGTLACDASYISAMSEFSADIDRAAFADYFRMRFGCGARISVGALLSEKPASALSISYVKNAYADEAYDVFSQDFEKTAPLYVSTLREAVDKVRQGEAGYCLLPLEEAGGLRSYAVETLIYRYDLKITAVTPVFGYDGTADMKYALISAVFHPTKTATDDDMYLEIRCPKDTTALSDLIGTARIYGIETYRIGTSSFGDSGDRQVFHTIVFKDTKNKLPSFLCWLFMFLPDFTPVGIYKNLE